MISPTKCYIIGLIGLLLQSCDPTYSIRITNKSDDTLTVSAKTTINFNASEGYSIKSIQEADDEDWEQFKIPPKEEFDCGMAIAGLRDEIPFTALKIKKGEEQIVANTEDEVLDLFEKDLGGSLVTPYRIVIE